MAFCAPNANRFLAATWITRGGGRRGAKSRAFPPWRAESLGGLFRLASCLPNRATSAIDTTSAEVTTGLNLDPECETRRTRRCLAVAAFCRQQRRWLCFNRLMRVDSHCGVARSS